MLSLYEAHHISTQAGYVKSNMCQVIQSLPHTRNKTVQEVSQSEAQPSVVCVRGNKECQAEVEPEYEHAHYKTEL